MKVALIITGQSRSWELCIHFIKSFILDNYDCDIFISLDTNNKTQLLYKNTTCTTPDSEITRIINAYSPVDFYITNESTDSEIDRACSLIPEGKCTVYSNNTEQKVVTTYLIGETPAFSDGSFHVNDVNFKSGKVTECPINKHYWIGLLRQYFFLHKGYEMLDAHIKKTGVKYDCIIRLRFDHIVWDIEFAQTTLHEFDRVVPHNDIAYTARNISLAKTFTKGRVSIDDPEENTIKVLGGGVITNYTYVNDFFWTHGSDMIDKMMKFYPQLPLIIKNCMKTFWPSAGAGIEHFLSVFLFENNIKIKLTAMNRMAIIRTL